MTDNNDALIDQMLTSLMEVPLSNATCEEVMIAFCKATAIIARIVEDTEDNSYILEEVLDLIRDQYENIDMDITVEDHFEH